MTKNKSIIRRDLYIMAAGLVIQIIAYSAAFFYNHSNSQTVGDLLNVDVIVLFLFCILTVPYIIYGKYAIKHLRESCS